MFDFSWGELFVVVVVAVLVIGPQDIPKVMRVLGRLVRRGQYLKFALSRHFDDFMKEHDLQELQDFRRDPLSVQPDTDEEESDAEFAVSHHSQPARERVEG